VCVEIVIDRFAIKRKKDTDSFRQDFTHKISTGMDYSIAKKIKLFS
jgi:hypothetical protein